MASDVSICNLALQKLGAQHITSLSDNSRNARACNLAYASARDMLLRRHTWNFAKTQAVLAPDTDAPLFDYQYAFTLPSDCLRILLPNDYDLDWSIKRGRIYTNSGNVLNLEYIARITDPNEFDADFAEAFACRMAMQMAEELTQSNSKKADVEAQYKDAIASARRNNAFEDLPEEAPVDPWIVARF